MNSTTSPTGSATADDILAREHVTLGGQHVTDWYSAWMQVCLLGDENDVALTFTEYKPKSLWEAATCEPFRVDEWVRIYALRDAQGRPWVAVADSGTNPRQRALVTDAEEAGDLAVRIAGTCAPSGEPWHAAYDERIPANAQYDVMDLFDEHRDPMDEPEASYCADCGAYPLDQAPPCDCRS